MRVVSEGKVEISAVSSNRFYTEVRVTVKIEKQVFPGKQVEEEKESPVEQYPNCRSKSRTKHNWSGYTKKADVSFEEEIQV